MIIKKSFIIILTLFLFFQNLCFSKSKEEVVNEIKKILENKYLKNSDYSIRVISKDKKETIISINESVKLIPASTIKVLTTSAALNKLGPSFLIKTRFLSDSPINNGTIKGNFYIKGYGNPLLTSDDLKTIAEYLYKLGLRTIEGNIVLDNSYFENKLFRKDWIDDDESNEENAISAISLNNNSFPILIHSFSKVNTKPEIKIFNEIPNIKIINNLRVKKVNKRKEKINIVLKENNDEYVLSITGIIRPSRIKYYSISIKDPAIYFGKFFKTALQNIGINLKGKIVKGLLPTKNYEIFVHSIKIDSLIKVINKHSNNFCADHLFKILGAELISIPGTSKKGANVIKKFLKENGIDSSHFDIYDGSGLSKKNKVSTYCISQILYNNALNYEFFNIFSNSLSIAGNDGTLKHRMIELTNPQNVKGKSGTLSNACTLVGYITSIENELLIYAIFINNFKRNQYEIRKLQDKIVYILSEFSRNNKKN